MKKKFLTAALLTFAALTLVVVTVFVTVAYLTASSAVSNVFTVGDVSITMYETKVDANGTAVTPYTEVDTNSYHLVPDKTYLKDPTIRITSKLAEDEMYLFVKSSNQIRKIEAGNQADATNDEKATSMRAQMEANGWVEYVRSGDGIEIVWVYGTRDTATGVITPTAVGPDDKQILKNGNEGPKQAGDFVLCNEFTVAHDANVSLYAAAKVNFTAFAIQTTGVETIQKAWEAIKTTFPYEGGIINPVNPYNNSSTNPYDAVAGVENPLPVN
ncbi:MAG: hypothetical protein E7551_07260 [Ruminococcaceae bacterium]|nr:hypothetical protein [Oscillospiraceae bacterium]